MCGRDVVHVEHFAIRGQPTMEIVAIPGRHADLGIVALLARHIALAGNLVGLSDHVDAMA